MEEAAKNHRKIATSIRELVVNPFSRWCDAHESRVQGSQDELQARIKHHDRQADTVRKLRSHYFNKCRLVEDIEEENKLAFQDPSIPETSPKQLQLIPEIKVHDNTNDNDDDEPLEIGDEVYQPEQVKKILTHMLHTVRLAETKVPILGTYPNTSAGADIVEYFQKHLGATSVSHAERIGQDLVSHGFLRLVGNVGSIFANSSKMFYQWRPKAFQITGISENKKPLNRTFSLASNPDISDSPIVGTMGEYLANWNPLNNQHPNETPAERLRREAAEADDRYKAGVRKLDQLRCQLEEAMVEHLKFMERCELDRLKAIKAVILDFSGAISNVIPSLQSTVDNMMLYQETVQPLGDLRYLLESYRTGGFAPKVQVYDNYYNSSDEQTFGLDLEARARADKKRVPNVVTSILTFLDTHYPDMEGDEARRGVWLVEVPLPVTHRLREEINNGKAVNPEVLERYEIPIVASVLKLYLLELPGMFQSFDCITVVLWLLIFPDSLVSSHVYEIIKTIYSTPASETTDSDRIKVLQNTLIQLRLANIATLDALMTHFTRLIELTSANESYIAALAHNLSSAILRPRQESSMTMEEKHAYRLIRDLFAHKDQIFGELKRASSLSHSTSVDQRPRAISTDESNRKANMEARNRAILAAVPAGGSRSRATSPAPSPRGHRRDRSSGGPETRFPIQTSPTTAANQRGSIGNVIRNSLEVPGSVDTSVDSTASSQSVTNGSRDDVQVVPNATNTDGVADDGLEKRNSLGRSGHAGAARLAQARRGAAGKSSLGNIGKQDIPESHRPVGVSLTDRPMDD